ncbi:MAG: hypothetical protein ACE1ZK_04975 [Nitrospirales bacterium]
MLINRRATVPQCVTLLEPRVPLVEILSEIKGTGVTTKGVTGVSHRVLADLGNEFSILMDVPIVDIEEYGGTLLAIAIQRMREGNVTIAPGYHGESGTVRMLTPEDRETNASKGPK